MYLTYHCLNLEIINRSNPMKITKTIVSNDNTKKYFIDVGETSQTHIEACLLNLSKYGYIICVSSQIGCSQKCRFCASGNNKFLRNLTALEIEEQIRLIIENTPELKHEDFQVTYMGSGEPLCNYQNVFDSIDRIRAKFPKLSKVNISTTCPISAQKCFKDIAWEKYKNFLHFQYSLHFTNDSDRYKFLYPQLMEISEAIGNFNRICTILNDTYKINYIPFDTLNDNDKSIKELIIIMNTAKNAVLKISTMCEINGSSLLPTKSFEAFSTKVKNSIENVEIFNSDGVDINAGCGQFYNESIT